MSTVKYIFVSLILMISFSSSAINRADYNEVDPYILLSQIAETTFQRFNNEYEQIKANPEHLKTIISDELLPYVDYKYASFKVLGNNNMKKMTKQQIRDFILAFKDYMVTVYAQVFTNYRSSQLITVEPSKSFFDKKIVVVKSKISEPGKPDIDIFFKLLRKTDKKTKDISWSAYDLDAEGISMLDTKRKEINEAIKRNGIDAVIKDLKDKSQKPLTLKNSVSQ